jgi:Ser/Thr protein kinase RdoA (MazF antagonist)
MSGSVLAVQSSILSADALAVDVLPRYALPRPIHCRLISHGVNDVYRVEAGGQRAFLRISPHGWRSAADVEAEVAAIAALHRHGVRVAPARPLDEGGSVARLPALEGERVAVLFAAAEGSQIADVDARQSRAYGRLAASMHAAADAAPIPCSRPAIDEHALLDAPLAAIRAAIPASDDLAFLASVAARIRPRLRALPRTAPGFGFCHGDLHPANVRFAADGQPTLFDFDFCGPGWRAYDLTVFLWNAFGERRPKRWRDARWRAFLRGYREVSPLPDGLDELLPLFLAARQIWLTGIDFAGHGGWLPQWLTPDYLREMALPVRRWVAAYPVLDG